MIITETFRAYLADLADDGDLAATLHTPLPLYAVWADLCRLAGEPEPPEVAALLDAPAATLLTGPARFIPSGLARR